MADLKRGPSRLVPSGIVPHPSATPKEDSETPEAEEGNSTSENFLATFRGGMSRAESLRLSGATAADLSFWRLHSKTFERAYLAIVGHERYVSKIRRAAAKLVKLNGGSVDELELGSVAIELYVQRQLLSMPVGKMHMEYLRTRRQATVLPRDPFATDREGREIKSASGERLGKVLDSTAVVKPKRGSGEAV